MPTSRFARTDVSPTAPATGYQGGKRLLAKRLIARIADADHLTYAEPFVGMGGVFLRRPFRAQAEVINDWSRDVATFFRVLQRHYVAFVDMLRFQLTSRVGFDRLIRTDPTTLTDLERAARFLYLQRLAFGGKVSGRTFGVAPTSPARFDVTRLGPMLEAIHERLAGVVVECLPFDRFIRRYDRDGTLFYCDPPYYGCEGDYCGDDGAPLFGRDDLATLVDRLRAIKGRFILSINDHPDVRSLCEGLSIDVVPTTYTVASKAAKTVSELIVTGPK